MVVPFHIYERKDLLRNNINTLSRDTFHYQNVAISLKVEIEYKNFFTSMSLHNCKVHTNPHIKRRISKT